MWQTPPGNDPSGFSSLVVPHLWLVPTPPLRPSGDGAGTTTSTTCGVSAFQTSTHVVCLPNPAAGPIRKTMAMTSFPTIPTLTSWSFSPSSSKYGSVLVSFMPPLWTPRKPPRLPIRRQAATVDAFGATIPRPSHGSATLLAHAAFPFGTLPFCLLTSLLTPSPFLISGSREATLPERTTNRRTICPASNCPLPGRTPGPTVPPCGNYEHASCRASYYPY
jgi:hypothetical protein